MACRGGRLCHYSVSRRYRAGLGVPMPTCTALSVVSGRLSYAMRLKGPALSVDTGGWGARRVVPHGWRQRMR